MKWRKVLISMTLAAGVAWPSASAAEDDGNLVKNGGFEETREEALTGGGQLLEALKGGCDFGNDLFATLPKNFDQFIGAPKCFKLVQGAPGKEVHSGEKALLFNGFFYIQDTLTVSNGTAFTVRYFAKGQGKTCLRLVVWDPERKQTSQVRPSKPTQVEPDDWTLVTFELAINDEHACRAGILLEAEGDVTIDDLSITESEKAPAPDAKQP